MDTPHRLINIIGIILLFLLAMSCASSLKEKKPTSPLPSQPVAHFPKMAVGDSMAIEGAYEIFAGPIYWPPEKNSYEMKIIEVKPDGGFVVEVKDRRRGTFRKYFDNKYQLVRMLDIDTGTALEIPIPPEKLLDFPLYVGKRWKDKFRATYVAGFKHKYFSDYTIDKYETVNTRVGSFKAFKISRETYNINKEIIGFGYFGAEYWYAPEVKGIVKYESNWTGSSELISYNMADKMIAIDTTPPIIEITSPQMEGDRVPTVATKQTEIRGMVRDNDGVKWVKVNDKKVTLAKSGEFSYTASLSEGENPFTVEASDIHGNEARKTVMIRYEAPKLTTPSQQRPEPTLYKPVCWVFSIGVSDYRNNGLSLQYAHHDAQAVADFFEAQKGKLFPEVFVKTLINEECTRANIMENFASYLGKAAPDDVVFIFVAGHGVRHKQTGSYYFLTYNADSRNLIYEALKWSDFEEAIKILSGNVNKVVLVLDTCHAGAMRAYLRGIEGGEDLAIVLKESSGLYILASSKSGEDSVENGQFTSPVGKKGHGAFTYALLRGLSGEANHDRDSYVSIYELFKYVAKIVPRITNGRQHPYSRITGTDMPIAEVRSE